MSKMDETADVKSVRHDARDPWLVISSAAGVRTIPLPRMPRVVIGRMHTCDIVIDDESVSREHAALHTTNGLVVEDLGSRNKTKVMGRALTRGESAPITIGSVVEIGYATMFIQVGRPAGGRASSPGLPGAQPWAGPAGAGAAGGGPGAAGAGGSTLPVILDPTMQRLYALLDVIAPSPLNVLVFGETGTGKEVFAETMHAKSLRANAPFLRINCAALSGSLLESELFGHERGAFTGALGAKAGLFEAADGGTVFLDEIGELPIDTQAKLLRVIERGEVIRLGSVQPKRVDVRYVAATNRDLQQLIAENRFRSDLFFRLNGFSVTLPPLRKRRREIVPLARVFVDRVAQGRPYLLTPEAGAALEEYPWPGNVRELKNVLERAFVLAGPQARIDPMHLHLPESAPLASDPYEMRGPSETWPPPAGAMGPGMGGAAGAGGAASPTPAFGVAHLGAPGMPGYGNAPFAAGAPAQGFAAPAQGFNAAGTPGNANDLRAQRETWERQQILVALEKTSGNQKEAAKLLGISRRTLINKIEAYGIARPRKR